MPSGLQLPADTVGLAAVFYLQDSLKLNVQRIQFVYVVFFLQHALKASLQQVQLTWLVSFVFRLNIHLLQTQLTLRLSTISRMP